MEPQKTPVKIESWVVVVSCLALLLVLFNVDPVGNGIRRILGEGSERATTNVILILLIAYSFVNKK